MRCGNVISGLDSKRKESVDRILSESNGVIQKNKIIKVEQYIAKNECPATQAARHFGRKWDLPHKALKNFPRHLHDATLK